MKRPDEPLDPGPFADDSEPTPEFSDERWQQHYEAKEAALERILGPMDPVVGHAVIPFSVGGAVDMYYFSQAMPGTVFATMELILPDGSGPKPGSMGTYELLACTRLQRPPSPWETGGGSDFEIDSDPGEPGPFEHMNGRVCSILTRLGFYTFEEELNPGETAELAGSDGQTEFCLVLDAFDTRGVPFEVEGRQHGLLLCIEVHPSELAYARKKGSKALLAKLKKAGAYPYSDLGRPPVA